MKAFYLSLVFLFLSVCIKSQLIISSSTFIQTCVQKTQCFSINNASFLFYDESKQALYLKLDFNKFKTGQDTIDDWLTDLTSTNLYFKAPLGAEQFTNLSNHNHKTLKLNGQVYLNGIWHSQTVELSLFVTESNLLNNNNNESIYDVLKMNFSLSILPRDFKVHKKPHHLRKTIFIGISLGRVNQLRPGQEQLLEEAYYH